MDYKSYKKMAAKLNRSKVSFDLDGVCLSTSAGAIKIYNDLYGRFGNKKIRDLKTFYQMTFWLEDLKNKEVFFKDPMEESIRIWNDPKSLLSAEAEKGTTEVMKMLQRFNITPYFITSRLASLKKITTSSCTKNLPGFKPKMLFIQEEGEQINHEYKAETIRSNKITYHFEDAPHHAEKIVERSETTIVILVDQPWNLNYMPTSSRIFKSHSKYKAEPKLLRAFLTLNEVV